jgi:hypothetical protein
MLDLIDRTLSAMPMRKKSAVSNSPAKAPPLALGWVGSQGSFPTALTGILGHFRTYLVTHCRCHQKPYHAQASFASLQTAFDRQGRCHQSDHDRKHRYPRPRHKPDLFKVSAFLSAAICNCADEYDECANRCDTRPDMIAPIIHPAARLIQAHGIRNIATISMYRNLRTDFLYSR